MEIIGLAGYARSGKDEAAKILVEEYGFTRVAFADKLREFLYALNPLIHPSEKNYFGLHKSPTRLQDVIDRHSWDGYKETDYKHEIRALLQRLGTEAGRDVLGENIWVDAALDGVEAEKIVVTDCRFPNEAKAIVLRDGQLWRVNRAGVGPAKGADGSVHSSETSLDDLPYDVVLFNDGALETYHENVRRSYESRVRQ